MKGLQGKKILVSGVGSVLGGKVAQQLAEFGAKVFVLASGGDQEREISTIPGCCTVSMESVRFRENLPFNPEIILFLNHPEFLINNMIDEVYLENYLPDLLSLLRLAGRHASYFVYASSVAVYGKQKYLPIDEEHPLEPNFLFGSLKLAGEYFCRSYAMEKGFSYSVLRYGDLYGPGLLFGEPVVFLKSAIKNEPLVISGLGGQVRSYIFVEDAIEGTISVLVSRPTNQIINLAGNEYVSIWHLASTIKQNYCKGCEIKPTNNILMDELECCIDSGKARELLGFQAKTGFYEGLLKTYSWLLNKTKRFNLEG